MEEQVQSQPNEIKIQKTMDEEEDRISDLHDRLLLDILSRLDSTKEAIRTGVLSKRWQHLWPSVPILTFHHYKFNNLLLGLDPDPNLDPDPDFFLFVNHTLKSLSLGCGKVDEDLIQNILSGSHVLETLNLLFVYGIRQIDISSKSVKNLRFTGGFMFLEEYPNSTHVEINAPYISFLKLYCLIFSKLVLLNVSSLVKAKLNYVLPVDNSETHKELEEEEEMLKGLILKLRYVKELKIGDLCLEALSGLEAKGFTRPSNIKTNKTWDWDVRLFIHGAFGC